jgi:lipopolysaccharide transport system ATP-binding protein
MTAVISVQNLGKKYILSHQYQERYTALRDVISGAARRMFSKFRHSQNDATHEEFWALRDVGFDIRQGDRVGIIGRNGAGKSTLLKVLSRITEPTTGTVKIKGRVASLLEVGTGFHPELTGRENIYLNGAILGMSKAEISRKFDEIVSFAEVERFLDTPVKRYSSGMYVRLAFAVAAHLEPEILIVDEVLAVGDAHFQKKCMGKMDEVGKEGRTVLFVSHNMGAIHALCNRCILLDKGQVLADGETLPIISRYNATENKRELVKITPSMRNRGDGEINFKSCAISDSKGSARNTFHIGEDIRVAFRIHSEYAGEISFWLIIFDSTGTPLLSTHQRDQELVEVAPGEYVMTYQTEGLGLMPGHYTISAGAFDPRLKFLEWVEQCQAFEVYSSFINGTSFDGRWGKLNQQAHWGLERMS